LNYDDEYIPFSYSLRDVTILPETIYARNLSSENFIEFRFDFQTKRLYEITLVSIQPNAARDVDNIHLDNHKDAYYACLLENNSELQISQPVKIFKSSNALSLSWSTVVDYFPVGNDFYIGIDANSSLCGVVVTSLSEIMLAKILE